MIMIVAANGVGVLIEDSCEWSRAVAQLWPYLITMDRTT
jgi:hypothetical protein